MWIFVVSNIEDQQRRVSVSMLAPRLAADAGNVPAMNEGTDCDRRSSSTLETHYAELLTHFNHF